MQTKNALPAGTKIYWGDWTEFSQMQTSFSGTNWFSDKTRDLSVPDGIEVLFAYYHYSDYTGEAFVLYRQDGKLFEVNASHCSCFGLEGQWEPEETSPAALRHIFGKGAKLCYEGSAEGEAARAALVELLAGLPHE